MKRKATTTKKKSFKRTKRADGTFSTFNYKKAYRDPIPKELIVPRSGQVVKLRYIETTTTGFTAGAASVALFQGYSANGLYDYSAAVGSTAIPGFTEWMALYKKYKVLSCSMKLTVCNLLTTPIYAGMITLPQGVSLTSWNNWMETRGNPQSVQELLNGFPAESSSITLNSYVRMKDVVGDAEFRNDAQYSGLYNANPGTAGLIQTFVYVLPPDNTTFANGVHVCEYKFETTFWVRLFEPFYCNT